MNLTSLLRSSAFMIFLLLSTCFIPSSVAQLDVTKFSKTLSTLARDGLGTATLQDAIDSLQFIERPVNGSTAIPILAASIANKFKERFDVVRELKLAVERSWTIAPGRTPTQCCQVKNSGQLEYDSRFRSKVDLSRICVKVSKNAPASPTHVADSVVEKMKKISQDYPVLKWQYFASEQGVLSNFPAWEDTADCGSYDPRFRPFYVETATPEPKDVVLVIDHSGSMSGSRMIVAKEAAKTVLRTMNPRDRIGIVKFNGQASTPVEYDGDGRGCHSQRLADATPINIKYLEEYVESIYANGGTDYSKAFIKAFDLFNGTSGISGSSRKKVIIFLTDGRPNDNEKTILQTIKAKNEELNNEVVIMTYGMLANLPILRYIAEQEGLGVTKQSDVTAGKFTYVSNTNTLRNDMATYYDFFSSKTIRNEPIISIPYVDAFGTGLLTSITLPCYHQGKFIGVVGTDISMADLLSEVTYFQTGQRSYAWMADSSGRTMMHPLLPAPSDAYGDPIFMDITALEPEPGFNEIFNSIKVGRSGMKSFTSKRFLARGGKIKEGVSVLDIPSTYFWRAVEKTKFTVGIVVADGDKDETLSTQSIPSDFKFLYHRLDLVRPDEPCAHFSRYAAKGTTVVKFGAEAFTDPYTYLGLDEAVSRVKSYKSYMTSSSALNPGFKPGIRDTVLVSSKVDDIWLREKAEYTKYLVWRYFGTANGVFRITPGTLIAKSYDPTKRPWYHAALRNTGRVSLSTPYIDAFGSGVVITASHTIYRGEATHKHSANDQVIGVMGADFPLSYFHKLLTDTFPSCKDGNYECFVLDGAGFLVMHKDFLSPDIKAKDLEYVHITAKEKEIAEDLLQKGHLVKKKCRHLEKIHTENFYELSIPFQGLNTLTTGQRCRQYQLAKVAGSNAFLGIKKRDDSCPFGSCITCGTNRECSNPPVSSCECPCISRLDFHYCRNEFPASNVPICPVPAPVVPSEQVKDPSTKGLQKCFDPQCDKKLNSDSCDGIVGCYWCVRDKHDAPLNNKYCADINSCYGGKEGTRAPGSTNIPKDKDGKAEVSNKSGMSAGAIAGIVLGVIGFIVVIILIVVKLFKRERIPKITARTGCIGRGVPPPAPSSVVHSPPPQPYKVPYASEPGTSMQLTGITPRYESPPPSYGEIQPSAPPYNPYYKQSVRHK